MRVKESLDRAASGGIAGRFVRQMSESGARRRPPSHPGRDRSTRATLPSMSSHAGATLQENVTAWATLAAVVVALVLGALAEVRNTRDRRRQRDRDAATELRATRAQAQRVAAWMDAGGSISPVGDPADWGGNGHCEERERRTCVERDLVRTMGTGVL